MSTYEIQVGDFVHGRLYNEDRSSVVVQDFVISEIDGVIFKGGVLDCDTAAGWEIELIRKSRSNLNLPAELSEITGYGKNGKKYFLTGKGSVWRDEQGRAVDIFILTSWEAGHV